MIAKACSRYGGGVALVFEDNTIAGPATHALVVGVGDYPHLPGGSSGIKAKLPAGMRPLSSPPVSARAFSDWLIRDFNNPVRPLASVELLVNSAPSDYQPPERLGVPQQPGQSGAATLKAISDAAVRWKARGNIHPDSLLIFYFCGHGLSQGSEFAVVANDYGANEGLPLAGLIDVKAFLIGMNDCAAREQCYFIDACRTADASLIDVGHYGESLVQKIAAPTVGLAQSVYYSTLGGEVAHGRQNEVSVYTQALLRSLGGLGASNTRGRWWVNTTRLLEALSHQMTEMSDPKLTRVQVPQSGSQVTFDLHQVCRLPPLPLTLGFDGHEGPEPPATVKAVTIRQAAGDVASYPASIPPLACACDWQGRYFESWLEAGLTSLKVERHDEEPPLDEDLFLVPPGISYKHGVAP